MIAAILLTSAASFFHTSPRVDDPHLAPAPDSSRAGPSGGPSLARGRQLTSNQMKSRTITANSSTQSNSICHPKVQRCSVRIKLLNYSLGLIIYATVLLLGNRLCFATNPCPIDGQVSPMNEETLDPLYQPYPAGTPAVLARYRFAPDPSHYPGPTYPTVLMLPPNIFRDDKITDEGEPHEQQASYDLQQQGFLVFQVDTRLAPPGHLPNQLDTDKGYAPEQTDDLKRQILAALNDPLHQCNGNIYLVGGSSGGTLALWCALDPASTVSGWDEDTRSHIKAVVSLSGPSQFCDFMDPDGGIPTDVLTDFEHDLENYVHLPYSSGSQAPCDPACDFGAVNCALDQASPAWLVTNGATRARRRLCCMLPTVTLCRTSRQRICGRP